MNDSIKTITKRSSVVFVGKIFDSFLMFIVNIIGARVLGVDSYGTYVYVFTFIMMCSIMINVGLDQGISGILPKYDDKDIKKNVVSFSILSVYLISIGVIIITFIFSDFIAIHLLNNKNFGEYLIKFVPLLLFLPLTQLSEGIFRTIGGIRHYIIAKNIIVPVCILLSLIFQVLVLDYKSIYTLLYSNYFGWITCVVYIFVILFKQGYIRLPKLEYKNIYIKLILLSLPLIFVGIFNYLMGRIDSYMIGYMLDGASVGIYNVADKVAYISSFLFVAVSSMFAPGIARIYHDKAYDKLKLTYKKLTRWILIVNVGVFFVILINSNDILNVFGQEYKSGNLTLIILALAYLINASFGPVVYMNAMTGKEKNEFYVSLSMLSINVVANYIFINLYGLVGAAYATVVVFSIGNVCRLIILYKNLNIVPFSIKYLTVIVSGIGVYILTHTIIGFIKVDNYILRIFIYSGIYVILYLVGICLFSIEKDEREGLISICKKREV